MSYAIHSPYYTAFSESYKPHKLASSPTKLRDIYSTCMPYTFTLFSTGQPSLQLSPSLIVLTTIHIHSSTYHPLFFYFLSSTLTIIISTFSSLSSLLTPLILQVFKWFPSHEDDASPIFRPPFLHLKVLFYILIC